MGHQPQKLNSVSALQRIKDVIKRTPLDFNARLSERYQCEIYLKREDQQVVRSYKLRGAYNMISQLQPDQLAKGVVCASAGNHAQGVALSANKLSIHATIVMPRTTPLIKIDAVKSYGATVVLAGDNYSEAYEFSMKMVKKLARSGRMITINLFAA